MCGSGGGGRPSRSAASRIRCRVLSRKLAGDGAIAERVHGWIQKALEWGIRGGEIHRAVGLMPRQKLAEFFRYDRDSFLQLTRDVQNRRTGLELVRRWVDACTLASVLDEFGLVSAEALVTGTGWYRCWLKFVLRLCAAEAQPSKAPAKAALNAIAFPLGLRQTFRWRAFLQAPPTPLIQAFPT